MSKKQRFKAVRVPTKGEGCDSWGSKWAFLVGGVSRRPKRFQICVRGFQDSIAPVPSQSFSGVVELQATVPRHFSTAADSDSATVSVDASVSDQSETDDIGRVLEGFVVGFDVSEIPDIPVDLEIQGRRRQAFSSM